MNEALILEEKINDFLNNSEIVVHGENMLSRMEDLMQVLGNPENNLRVIHIAGTSGKTSTSYFVASLLESAGKKTCLTVSPHIDTVRERAMINLLPLAENIWTECMTEFFEIVKKSGIRPSYFEFFMGFAYWLGEKEKVDFMVVETGLGGLWDGSNVARRADKVCVISDIGKDHIEILGDDIRQITREKAGVIHAGNMVFMNGQDPEIEEEIHSRVEQMGAEISIEPAAKDDFFERNFALALRATEYAISKKLDKNQLKRARSVHIPARAEEFTYKGKLVILDGSHNPQKIAAFVRYMQKKYRDKKPVLLVSLGDNKKSAADEDLALLRDLGDEIILTSFKNEDLETRKRASLSSEILRTAAIKARFTDIKYIHEANEALEFAVCKKADLVVATGSLFLTTKLREILKNAQG